MNVSLIMYVIREATSVAEYVCDQKKPVIDQSSSSSQLTKAFSFRSRVMLGILFF